MTDDGAPDVRREDPREGQQPETGPGPATAEAPVRDEPRAGASLPADRLLAAGRPVTVPLAFLVGATIGLLGTVVHRAVAPWGLLLALGAALSGGVLARSLGGGLGVAAHVAGLILVTQLAATLRPGGDVLVVDDPLGYAWLYASVLAGAVAIFLPGRWFDSGGGRP